MELSARENLINSVVKDDAAAFGAFIAPEVLSAVFGRLPLLSLLYLYNAKRIIKRYYSDLVKERPRVKEQAFPEAERLFALKAGKCLRYYVSAEGHALTPIAVKADSKYAGITFEIAYTAMDYEGKIAGRKFYLTVVE